MLRNLTALTLALALLPACGTDGTGPGPIVANQTTTYRITMPNGLAIFPGLNGTTEPYSADADLILFPPVNSSGGNTQPNSVDLAIFTTTAPAPDATGAINFSTNTAIVGPTIPGGTGTDVAIVALNTADAQLDVTVDPLATGLDCTTPGTQNVVSADIVYKVVAGRVLMDFSPDSATVSGGISFIGNPCDGSVGATGVALSAQFTGTRTDPS